MNPRSARAWENFQVHIAELGGVVVESVWLGAMKPHRCICPNGHEYTPRPADIQQGRRACVICAGNYFGAGSAEFNAKIFELGGHIVESTWLGNDIPHRCICPNGHECAPRPGDIQQGQGMCRTCAFTYDRVYIVAHPLGWGKIGVASGVRRIREHISRGYELVEQFSSLPPELPLRIEKSTLRWIRSKGVPSAPYSSGVPLDGITETFPVKRLPSVQRYLLRRWPELSVAPDSLSA
jgi:hypothetical protein